MVKNLLPAAFFAIILTESSHGFDGKTIGHLISIPIIEGTGIYSSIRLMQTGGANATASAVTNLSLIVVNSGVGAYTLFGKPADYTRWRTVHRITGFVTGAAGIWLAASAGINNDVAGLDKGIAAGYGIVAVVPVVMFSF
ncbi:MAG: hypothetical protein JXA18_08935 [Chitinispirillaceae bacterium]|nr:hypothetical protein [Chitinispirillaceae bacterium]